MLEARNFEAGDFSLHYVIIGAGKRPLLFLHGGISFHQQFQPLFPSLSQDYTIYALDFRGYGNSSRLAKPEGYSWDVFRKDVLVFIRKVIQQPVIIYGHSLGGLIAVMVAVTEPELVTGLIIGDSPLFWERFLKRVGNSLFEFYRFMSGFASSPKPVLDLVQEIGNTPISTDSKPYKESVSVNRLFFLAKSVKMIDPKFFEAFENVQFFKADYTPTAYLPKIICPVLLIQADKDLSGVLTDEDVEEALELLPNGFHMYLEKVNHNLQLDKTEPVLLAIRSFLNVLE